MSLINQMLRDLESSRRGEPEQAGLPRTVQIVDEVPFRRPRWLWHGLLVTAVMITAVGGSFHWRQHLDWQTELSPDSAAMRPKAGHRAAPSQTLVEASPSESIQHPAPRDAEISVPMKAASALLQPVVQASPIPAPLLAAVSPLAPQTTVTMGNKKGVGSLRPPRRRQVPLVSDMATEKVPLRQKQSARPKGASLADEPDEMAEQVYRSGVRLYASGQDARAQDELERSLRLDPHNRQARVLLAKSYMASGDLDGATATLRAGAETLADTEMAKLHAQLLLKKGLTVEAERALERSLVASRDDPELLGVLGALRQRQGRHMEAVDVYQKAVRDQPRQSKWWLGLAISLDAEERYQEALDAYQRVNATGAPSGDVQVYVEKRIAALRGDR